MFNKIDEVYVSAMEDILFLLLVDRSSEKSIILCNTSNDIIFKCDNMGWVNHFDKDELINKCIMNKRAFNVSSIDNSLICNVSPIQKKNGLFIYFCIVIAKSTHKPADIHLFSTLLAETIKYYTKVLLIRDQFHLSRKLKCVTLNEKEEEIMRMITLGLKDRTIASTLYISYPTVRKYITTLFNKFDVTNRNELIDSYYKNTLYNITE